MKKNKINIKILIFFLIIFLLFCGICEIIKWGFRQEELKQQKRFEVYKMLETKLKEQRRVKIAMFRELEIISWCESRHNDEAKNPYSSALGCFQIIDSTKELCEKHLGRKIDRTNKQDSWDCAMWLYQRYGTKPWNASKHCWNK